MSQPIRSRLLAIVAASAASIAVLSPVAPAQSARDFINVVGSSTVYPFTTTVAEKFGRQGRFKTPKVESTGTGGGTTDPGNGGGTTDPGTGGGTGPTPINAPAPAALALLLLGLAGMVQLRRRVG